MDITQEKFDELDNLESQVATLIRYPNWNSLSEKYVLINSFVLALSEVGLDKETIYSYLDKLEKYARRELDAFNARIKAFKDLFE